MCHTRTVSVESKILTHHGRRRAKQHSGQADGTERRAGWCTVDFRNFIVFFGPRPWHIEIRHRVKKTSTINLFGFETLKLKIRRLKLWKPTVGGAWPSLASPRAAALIYVYIYIYIYVCIYIYIYIHIHTSIHPYTYTSIHPYIHTSIHPYIHTSIHTSIHPYIHTYIHTYTNRVVSNRVASKGPLYPSETQVNTCFVLYAVYMFFLPI